MLGICEKREGVILSTVLRTGAVLQELWYRAICFGELKGAKRKKKMNTSMFWYNFVNISFLPFWVSSRNIGLSLHSALPVISEACRLQPTVWLQVLGLRVTVAFPELLWYQRSGCVMCWTGEPALMLFIHGEGCAEEELGYLLHLHSWWVNAVVI